MDIDNIGKRILKIRQNTGFSQAKFARFSDVVYSYLAMVEVGKKKPSFNFIMSVLKATQVSADWLLLGKGSMYPQIKEKKPEIKEINEDRAAYGADKSPSLDDVFNILKNHWDKLSDEQKKALMVVVKEMIEKNEMREENHKIREFMIKVATTWPGDPLQIPSLSETSSAS
jgi:transcriptional regulator with XRE-family HTH domain